MFSNVFRVLTILTLPNDVACRCRPCLQVLVWEHPPSGRYQSDSSSSVSWVFGIGLGVRSLTDWECSLNVRDNVRLWGWKKTVYRLTWLDRDWLMAFWQNSWFVKVSSSPCSLHCRLLARSHPVRTRHHAEVFLECCLALQFAALHFVRWGIPVWLPEGHSLHSQVIIVKLFNLSVHTLDGLDRDLS